MERTPSPAPAAAAGRLLARGRDADIYECGPGFVLRRARTGRSLEAEARVMEHVRRAGYPVPRVHEVRAGGTELVMDRVHGPSMLSVLVRRPWRRGPLVGVLADLHRRLGAIAAPDGLRPLPDGGSAVVHLDLHPLNVLMARTGPVVIDWANAARGRPATDVAQTWMLLASSDAPVPAVVRRAVRAWRLGFVDDFLARTGMRAEAEALLPVVIARRLEDSHVTEAERAALVEWSASLRGRAGHAPAGRVGEVADGTPDGDGGGGPRRPRPPEHGSDEEIDEAAEETFPASDAPQWWSGGPDADR